MCPEKLRVSNFPYFLTITEEQLIVAKKFELQFFLPLKMVN